VRAASVQQHMFNVLLDNRCSCTCGMHSNTIRLCVLKQSMYVGETYPKLKAKVAHPNPVLLVIESVFRLQPRIAMSV
jgi:hypothetical protein